LIGVLDPLRPLLDQRRIPRVIADITKQRKRRVDSGKVRLRLLDDAAEILKDLPSAVDDPADFRFERNPAETAPPGNPNALEVSAERRPEPRRVFVDRKRTTGVRSGDSTEEERDIGDGARDRSRHREW
jgi:hypothetical protein